MGRANKTVSKKHVLSRAEKEANDYQWYKDKANSLINYAIANGYGSDGLSEEIRIQTNYDLFYNKLNIKDLEYVCNPLGNNRLGELPAKMLNRDIVSPKINALLGMEMKRPFSLKFIATNSEATTRKEEEFFKGIKDFVISKVMGPIRQQIELEFQQQSAGRELTKEEQQQIQQQIEEETKKRTPPQVKRYMEREYQDPAEVLSQQIINYLSKKLKLDFVFNNIFKYGTLSAFELAYIGIFNGEPVVWALDPKRYRTNSTPDTPFLEDGEWATYDYYMSPTQILHFFSKDLTKKEKETINEHDTNIYGDDEYDVGDLFSLHETIHDPEDARFVKVTHCTWKSLREIKFLTYEDENGEIQEMMVDETYEMNEDFGDISIEVEEHLEVYETWVIHIGEKIYVRMRPLQDQREDAKLPYYGATHNISIMDRLKHYQYYFNILWYRFELLAATDKGKKVLMNIGAVPDSAEFNLEVWQHYMESTPYMWFDPSEEGTTYQDANTVAKVIDLSYAGDMNKYIEMMEYVRQQAGRSIGITDQIEGQISPNQAVRNTQQSLEQSSNLLEPYFNLHDHVKKNIVEALVETAKIAYSENPKEYLSFVLDDMSHQLVKVNQDLLENSKIGVFMGNPAKAQEAMDAIKQLSHAAMQNQKAELSDIASLMRQEGIVEAEETLKAAERERREMEERMATRKEEMQKEIQQMANQESERAHERELEKIVLKEEERRKTEIAKGFLTGASFNPDTDRDGDGKNDYLELLQKSDEIDYKLRNLDLDEEKFQHQKDMDRKKATQEDKKLSLEEKKIAKGKKDT